MKCDPKLEADAAEVSEEMLDEIARLANSSKARGGKELVLNEMPSGRRRDYRTLCLLGNGLFLVAVIYGSQYLNEIGQLVVFSLWAFFNVMLIYLLFFVMEEY